MWVLPRLAVACLLSLELASDKASSRIDGEKRQGEDDANDGTRDDTYSCQAVLADHYVCEQRIEDGTPQATGERLHHIETERGGR